MTWNGWRELGSRGIRRATSTCNTLLGFFDSVFGDIWISSALTTWHSTWSTMCDKWICYMCPPCWRSSHAWITRADTIFSNGSMVSPVSGRLLPTEALEEQASGSGGPLASSACSTSACLTGAAFQVTWSQLHQALSSLSINKALPPDVAPARLWRLSADAPLGCGI